MDLKLKSLIEMKIAITQQNICSYSIGNTTDRYSQIKFYVLTIAFIYLIEYFETKQKCFWVKLFAIMQLTNKKKLQKRKRAIDS